MGLLSKAADAAPRGDVQTLEPPKRARKAQRSGLLHRSLEVLVAGESAEPFSEPAAPPTPAPKPGKRPVPAESPSLSADQATAEILSAIETLADGIELPSELFTTLATRLAIEKGALLLYDPLRLVYAPWASLGYDQTTLHRMRIGLGANDSFNTLANGSPIVLSDSPSLAPYQQYFSSREFSSISRLVLVPFIATGKLIGILLLTQFQQRFPSEQDFLACLARVAETGSSRLQRAREEKLRRAGAQGLRPGASPQDQIEHYLSSFGSAATQILLLSLSVEEYAQSILAAHAHLDPFRLHEDFRYFLSAFVSELGAAITLRQGLFFVALQGLDRADIDLFLHQLSSFLHGLFGGNGTSEASTGPRVLRSRSWPEEAGDLRELVEFFSS
jgi:hypothetical protein